MTEEFFDHGLESDRYLKAAKLTERFETELKRELRRMGDEIVEENQALFVEGSDPNWNMNVSSSGGVLAFGRFDYYMNRQNPDTEKNLKMNFAFRWVEASKMGHEDAGTLKFISYTIKRSPDVDYRKVAERTREGDWEVRVGNDPHGNYPGTFYVPVETFQEFKQGHQALKDHFSEFGSIFGKVPKS